MALPSFSSAKRCGSNLRLRPLHAPDDLVPYDDGASHGSPSSLYVKTKLDIFDTVDLPIHGDQLPDYDSTRFSTNHPDQPCSTTANTPFAISAVKYCIRPLLV